MKIKVKTEVNRNSHGGSSVDLRQDQTQHNNIILWTLTQ